MEKDDLSSLFSEGGFSEAGKGVEGEDHPENSWSLKGFGEKVSKDQQYPGSKSCRIQKKIVMTAHRVSRRKFK